MNAKTLKATLMALPLAISGVALAGDFRITVTNLTNAQHFTPLLAASHKEGNPVFTAGLAASPELEAVAEGGDTAPLAAMLENSEDTWDIGYSDGLLAPGASVSIDLESKKNFRHISLVSMLIPTNDAFIGLSGIKLPTDRNKPVSLMLPAYDAGTEINDESCAHIPGPVCGGEGISATDGEGFISVHRGINGIADLPSETYDWRNPTASVTIEKL